MSVADYSGFDDWRMPTIKELGSIVNFGVYDPAIDSEWFLGTQSTGDWSSSKYWSSTTYFYDTSSARGLGFPYGYDYYFYKSSSGYVRAGRPKVFLLLTPQSIQELISPRLPKPQQTKPASHPEKRSPLTVPVHPIPMVTY